MRGLPSAADSYSTRVLGWLSFLRVLWRTWWSPPVPHVWLNAKAAWWIVCSQHWLQKVVFTSRASQETDGWILCNSISCRCNGLAMPLPPCTWSHHLLYLPSSKIKYLLVTHAHTIHQNIPFIIMITHFLPSSILLFHENNWIRFSTRVKQSFDPCPSFTFPNGVTVFQNP